jgi:hypothetical protein
MSPILCFSRVQANSLDQGAQIRRYAVALEICLFLHQNLLFKIGKQQNCFDINL